MSACIALRDDYDSLALRDLARRSRAPRQVRRLLALAAAYDGVSRTEAAKVGGMDRQTLRDWAHRFNDEGPDGLKHRSGAGRPRLLTQEQMSELSAIVETGPDPEVDGVVRWRRIDLKRVIEERFGVIYSERTLSDLLAALSFSHISGRPQHPRQDARVPDPLHGDVQFRLHRIALAFLERGIDPGDRLLTPLLEPENLHAQLPRQKFHRLATQKPQGNLTLARHRPPLAKSQRACRRNLARGKRGRAKLALVYHRPINSNFVLKIVGHVPVLLGHFD